MKKVNNEPKSLIDMLKINGFDDKSSKLIMELVENGRSVYENDLHPIGGSLKDITPTQNNMENVFLWVNVCIEIWKECVENGVELISGEFHKVGDYLSITLSEKVMESELIVMERLS